MQSTNSQYKVFINKEVHLLKGLKEHLKLSAVEQK